MDIADSDTVMHGELLLLRNLIDQSKDLVLVSDPETGALLHVNDTACRYLGYSREELLRMRMQDLATVVPGGADWPGRVTASRKTGCMVFEDSVRSKDGPAFPVEANFRYVSLEGRDYIVAVLEDITRRKDSEKTLSMSEERFRLAMLGANDGLWDWDLRTDKVYYSPRWKSMLGYSDDELEENLDTWKRLVHPDDMGPALASAHDFIEGRADKYELEFRLRHKEGHYVDILSRASLIRGGDGQALRLVGTHVDITERKKATSELLRSEKKFRDITSSLAEGIYVVNRQGNIIFMNPEAERLLGRTAEELAGKNAHELIHCSSEKGDPGLPMDDCGMLNVIKTGIPFSSAGEFFLRKDGTSFPISVVSSPIIEDGQIVAAVASFRDISESKKTEAERERLFLELGNANKKLGQEISERRRAEEKIKELNEDLEKRIIERTAQLESINRKLLDEIAGHKRTEEKLLETTQRFQLATTSGRLGIWDWDVRSNTMLWDDRMLELYGCTRENFPGGVEAWQRGLHPGDREKAWAESEAALRGDKEFDTEFRVLHPDGAVRVIKANAVVIRDAKGKAVRMLGLNSDITELREAEKKLSASYGELETKVQKRTAELSQKQRQLEELNMTLEQKVKEEIASRQEKEHLLFQQSRMAAMGEMIGAIAHQWRQPLNVIGLIVQNLKMAYDYGELDSERFKNAVASAMWQIKFMSRTIDDFRNFFKPSKDKEVFDVRRAVDETISLVKAQLQNNYISIEIISEKEGLTIYGYPNEFKHVLLNLINNAKDAILIRQTKEDCKAKITFEISGDDHKTVIKVRDTGGGVPDAIIDRIFDPYFTTKEESSGTGIGLYISKTMIERNMGGLLTVSNREDGAEFRIEV